MEWAFVGNPEDRIQTENRVNTEGMVSIIRYLKQITIPFIKNHSCIVIYGRLHAKVKGYTRCECIKKN